MRKNKREELQANQPPSLPLPPFLDLEAVCRMLNLPRGFVYDHTRRGSPDRIPCFRFGKHLRFHTEEIMEWVRQHRKF